MIANRFDAYRNEEAFLVFASGVSNSKDRVEQNFAREFDLLQRTVADLGNRILVYFSTCSVEDPDLSGTPYVIHKKGIEQFIRANAPRFYLFRVSNLGGTSNNPYTLLNHFVWNILAGQSFNVWRRAYRNIIDIDDMFAVADNLLRRRFRMNSVINIANPVNYPVPYIIKSIEKHLQKKAVYSEIDRGDDFPIDISLVRPLFEELSIRFGDDYLETILQKYYHSR